MQTFFESTTGKAAVIAVIAFILLLIMISGKPGSKRTDTKALAVSAMMIALAMVLTSIKIFTMPQGGTVTLFGLLPIVVCAYLLGTRRGVMAGVCVGLITLMIDPYVIHPVQLLLDYPVAFGSMGLAGLFRNYKNGLTVGYIFGLLCRYLCAVISGVVFFGEYAPEGFSALTWSLWYNITYIAVEGLITVIILNIPSVKKVFSRLRTQLEN